jgi:glycerophosphoryl diester phosphodiesterase
MFAFARPVVAAHRGFSARYPENTMAAFEAAIQANAQMIELDVTLSRDQAVVVIHDNTVDRTTNGSGRVNRLTLAEIKQLDAGSWFSPQFFQEKIPNLEEILSDFKNRVLINIEIKSDGFASMDSPDILAKNVVALVQEKHMEDQVLISSFSPGMLERVLTLDSALAVAVLAKAPYDRVLLKRCRELKAFSFHPERSLLNASMVDQCRNDGICIFVWNVQSAKDVKTCFRFEADGVIVDDPLMAIKQYGLLAGVSKR